VQACEGWREKVEAAIEEHGDMVIRFFNATTTQERDGVTIEQFDRYGRECVGSWFAWNQCVYLPAGRATHVAELCRRWKELAPEGRSPDMVIRRMLVDRREHFWSHVPHLVQHRVELKSGYGPRPGNRTSILFADLMEESS
jgi:hypothetical protein